ncbi:MAG: prepilin-type N-terminal cleavage/methylation domain-containing protein [Verrucomicrobiota bacterium]|jgi:prepilin-type N-terminal cleavage/methylation domain-containing protein
MKSRSRGFSLAELLCVIADLAVLAAIYSSVTANAFIRVKKVLCNSP